MQKPDMSVVILLKQDNKMQEPELSLMIISGYKTGRCLREQINIYYHIAGIVNLSLQKVIR